ncbi:hypothetical protein [Crossiella cryophila]|uniref:Uncharacterized protein n=1 Tax=Crossiella cryophila TaxID=43355 RepID=A0A7W7CIV9_9PSEU|nr:hypothetical protein [Crossiella cryophila]MBB4681782.1 hypothetical protein [Crossiella cryophila]
MPEDQLTLRERAALLALMAAARELTNAELHAVAGFTLDGACRRRLNELGLVTSTKVGRALVHELTDRGAVRCAAEFAEARPARAGYLGGALYAVLAGLRRRLDETGEVVADLFAPDVEGQVVAAYEQLTSRRGGTIRLAVLRERLDGVPRDEVDRALEAMACREGVHVRAETDQKTLTEQDRTAAVVLGGTPRHLLLIEASR